MDLLVSLLLLEPSCHVKSPGCPVGGRLCGGELRPSADSRQHDPRHVSGLTLDPLAPGGPLQPTQQGAEISVPPEPPKF